MLDVTTVEDAQRVLQDTDAEFVTVGIVDTQGLLRGKYVSRRKFDSALRDGMGVPAVTLGLDFHDVMAADSKVGGADTGYYDATVRVIPESCRVIPWEPERRQLFFQLEYADETAAICPRNVLRRVLERAAAQGLVPVTGLEYEFTLFNETSDSVVAKGHRDLQVATPHSTYYVLQRQSAWAEFYGALIDACRSLRIGLDSLHEEMGPGFMEATIQYGAPLKVADDGAVFKSYAKAVAHRRDLLLSFMARWSNAADGQSGHLHLSFRDTDRHAVLHDAEAEHGLSTTMLHMLGGLQALMPELLLMLAPNVNSFKRLVPGIFAPIAAYWGVENRSCALRVIPGTPGSTRVECRTPGADANPYFVIAALVGAGLHGIEHRIEPDPPLERDAYATEVPERLAFPATFREGIDRFRASAVARELFGDTFVDHYADTRDFQEREFRGLVTDRELERFFELA
jgi:glutamine synthetase